MNHDEEPKGDLVFRDLEAIVVTSEWNGKPKVISLSRDLIEADAGCPLDRDTALEYVSDNCDHYVELARELDQRDSGETAFQVEIGPDIDDTLLYSARRRLQERRAAADASDDIAAKLHYELSELHARRMHERR